MAELPFKISAEARNDLILFTASVDEKGIACERYRIGNGKKRREVAEKWASDPRLCNGLGVKSDDVIARLEALELECKEKLDAESIEETTESEVELSGGDDEASQAPNKSQATQLVDIVDRLNGVELWHNDDGDGYATIPVGTHFEHWRINSKKFRQYVSKLFYEQTGKSPSSQAMQDALTTLEGKAIHGGQKHEVYVRIGEHGGAIFLDLCNADWNVVKVTATGWEIVEYSPIKFCRTKGMLPSPKPIRGGSIDELRRFLNVGDDDTFILVVAWLIGTFRPKGPYPILEVNGEHGSGKSTQGRLLRRLIDPSKTELRSGPRDERDLVIAAKNGWVLGFDNFSVVQPWLSDALCRVATGGGFATRELYTNDDESIFSVQRPILVNGITELASRADLLDRTIRISLPQIPEDKRRPEDELWSEFDHARPVILGALLDAVSMAMLNLDTVKLLALPRMADFAKWVFAAEPSLPWEPGRFMAAYLGNREAGNELALEASPVADPLRAWLETEHDAVWSGTATELLAHLEKAADDKTKKQPGWPKRANALTNALKRIVPNLRTIGIHIKWLPRQGRKRSLTIERTVEQNTVTTVIDRHKPAPDAKNDQSCDDGSAKSDDPALPHRHAGNGRIVAKKVVNDDVTTGDDRFQGCSNDKNVDDSDRLEREAIMAIEAEAKVEVKS